jgi:hypothetical protein
MCGAQLTRTRTRAQLAVGVNLSAVSVGKREAKSNQARNEILTNNSEVIFDSLFSLFYRAM